VRDILLFPNLAYVSPSRWQHFKKPYCLLIGDQLAGVCQVYEFNNWIKLGPLVLLAKHHGKGLGKILLGKIIDDHTRTNIFIASSNPAVIHIVESLGFQRISHYFLLPQEVKLFLFKQLIEHVNITFVREGIRKKFFLHRNKIKLFINRSNPH
jgi:GNAT superfamily N-acetyltransferase